MLSNPTCKVCTSMAVDIINKQMAEGFSDSQILVKLSERVDRTLNVYDQFEIGYAKKRMNETLEDKDIVERNRLVAELEVKKALLDISFDDIESHRKKHFLFSDNQRGKQHVFCDKDVCCGVDFTQLEPRTEFGGTAVGVLLKDCDLTNCDLTITLQMDGCIVRNVSLCGHLNNDVPACEKLCEHVIKYDAEIVVDGVVVLRDVIEYANKEL